MAGDSEREGWGVIPSAFAYERAESVEQALALLQASGGEAKWLAGGHSLLPLMKLRLSTPPKLIDISRIPELRGVARVGDRLVIGALTTHRELAAHPLIREQLPALADAARQVGDLQVRNRGTLGGNLAHADTASDLPAVAVSLGAELLVVTPDGDVVLPAEEFFLGPLVTAMPENGLLKAVSFPVPPGHTRGVYEKFPHPASGYAVAGVAVTAGVNADGVVDYIRVGVTGAADAAYRAKAVEDALAGRAPTQEALREAAARAADDGVIAGDAFASEEYRRHLCTVLAERALRRALA